MLYHEVDIDDNAVLSVEEYHSQHDDLLYVVLQIVSLPKDAQIFYVIIEVQILSGDSMQYSAPCYTEASMDVQTSLQ